MSHFSTQYPQIGVILNGTNILCSTHHVFFFDDLCKNLQEILEEIGIEFIDMTESTSEVDTWDIKTPGLTLTYKVVKTL